MKRRMLFLIALGLLLLLIPTAVLAANGFTLDWWTVDSGGGHSDGGQYALSGGIGQPEAAEGAQGGVYTLQGGFWAGGPAPTPVFLVRLPFVLRH